ncbi:nose resistant to fluoxetine protein 6-like [Dermacentor variabilis]|uniref:nose resistant to fluoxetine protein 6-like n=1 Tax=Dermacentor variabilis TaxID=34621 RepID=UPI003F5C2FC8
MASQKSTRTNDRKARAVLWVFASSCVLLPFLAECSLAQNASVAAGRSASVAETARSPDNTVGEVEEIDYAQVARDVMAAGLSKVPRSLMRKVLQADVRSECSTALLRTMRALQNFEPWVLRLFDATGKYPTGMFESSHVDMGAFDECLDTVVRDRYGNVLSHGQYCNLLVHIENTTAKELTSSISDILHPRLRYFIDQLVIPEYPIVRLAVCYIDDCTQNDLQVLANSVRIPHIRLEMSNCVTAEPKPWSNLQIGIVTFAAIILVAIIAGTLVDHFVEQPQCRKIRGVLFQVAVAFSAESNTRMLGSVAGKGQTERHSLQFLHGIRLLAIVHIVIAHTYLISSDSFSGLLNLFTITSEWRVVFAAAAFNSVDTFFFLSGFLLCHIMSKYERNLPAVFIIAVLRRLIRMCVPLFFIIMWFYLLPRFVTGPSTEAFFHDFYVDIAQHWWHLLIQIRNLYALNIEDKLEHTWYLSADSQFFLVALLVLLIFRRRKPAALTALAVLSLLGCAIATWTVARLHLPPFVVLPSPNYQRMVIMMSEYYIRPFYHAVCYFSGCMTSLIVVDFRQRKISKTVQLVGWCASVICGIFCVLVKFPWYLSQYPTSQSMELLLAFFDRILWSFSLGWIVLTCATGRGGSLAKFLSWNAFVPLSKLSYGVYLIHWPFLELLMQASRERVYWSTFNQMTLSFSVLVWCFLLSYLVFIACEAPTGALEKLAFRRFIGGDRAQKQKQEEHVESGDVKTMNSADGNKILLRL